MATGATRVIVVTIFCFVESPQLFFNYLVNHAAMTCTKIVATTCTTKIGSLFGERIVLLMTIHEIDQKPNKDYVFIPN